MASRPSPKFFALVAPARTGYKMNKDFTLLDPLTSLRQYSQELNDPGTVHILISQLSEEQNKAILNEFPQINWIIQSNASQTTWTQPNEKLFTFQPLNRGRSVIFVSLSNDGSLQKVYSPEGANRLVGNRSYWQANIDAMKNEKNPEVIAKNKPVFDRFTGWLENTKNIPLEKNRDGAELRINTHELEIKYDSKTNAMTKLISDYKAETKQSALSK